MIALSSKADRTPDLAQGPLEPGLWDYQFSFDHMLFQRDSLNDHYGNLLYLPEMNLNLRVANSTDAELLSALALRAKAHWPYDADFIRDCADDLRISPERAAGGLITVGEVEGSIVGFYGFGADENEPEMTHLFVEPGLIGKGVGKALWIAAIAFAKAKNWSYFRILADPFASEKFYLPMGCKKIGEIESSVRPGRKLPLLRFDCA